jgi:hypothetical protein
MSDEIKIFGMNDCDWVAARTIEEARDFYRTFVGKAAFEEYEEEGCEPHEEQRINNLPYTDDEHPQPITFAEQLQRMIASGEQFPAFFATTEY